jgi:hypothetical protein
MIHCCTLNKLQYNNKTQSFRYDILWYISIQVKKQSILWHTDLIKETDSYTEVK